MLSGFISWLITLCWAGTASESYCAFVQVCPEACSGYFRHPGYGPKAPWPFHNRLPLPGTAPSSGIPVPGWYGRPRAFAGFPPVHSRSLLLCYSGIYRIYQDPSLQSTHKFSLDFISLISSSLFPSKRSFHCS